MLRKSKLCRGWLHQFWEFSCGLSVNMSNGTELSEARVYKQGSANTQSSIEKSIVSKLFGFVKDYPLKIQ